MPVAAALLAACATPLPPAPPPTAPVRSDAERYPPPRLRQPPPAPLDLPPPEAEPLPRAESSPLALGEPSEPQRLPPLPQPGAPSGPAPTVPLERADLVLKPAPRTVREAPAPGAVLSATPSPRPPPVPEAAVPPPAAPPAAGAPRASPGTPATAPADAGRWAVQVGVFAVPRNAETIRARVAQQLAQTPLAPEERLVEVVLRDGRSHVLVGSLPDRASAQRLAARLREALRQDVVLFQR